MPEITLRDLCRWDRRLTLLPPAGVSLDAVLDREVSWAVSVRGASPLLPPLRGDELVVLPPRVLQQIEAAELLTRAELVQMLANRHIAALFTDATFTDEPVDALPVLTLPAPFPHDAEGLLNRLITERRAELYRLGTELSRRLSQAAVNPQGFDALLSAAAQLAGRPLVLQDADGHMIAWGGQEMIEPADVTAMVVAQQDVGPQRVVDGAGMERLIVALSASGQIGYLSAIGPAGTLTEVDRLVLAQTAATCSAVLGQDRRREAQRGGRRQLVADLLLGRLASDAAAAARGQMLGLDTTLPVVVGLLQAPDGVTAAWDIVAQVLGALAHENFAVIPGGIGFLLPDAAADRAATLFHAALQRPEADGMTVALSRPIPRVARAPEGLRQVRFVQDLQRLGVLTNRIVSFASVDDLGLYALLYPLWGNDALEEFRQGLIGPLEEYDRRRGSDLAETLTCYLALGGALAEAAERLHIHRNTLSYRLRRISELTGRNLADPRDRLLLQIALAIRTLPAVRDEER